MSTTRTAASIRTAARNDAVRGVVPCAITDNDIDRACDIARRNPDRRYDFDRIIDVAGVLVGGDPALITSDVRLVAARVVDAVHAHDEDYVDADIREVAESIARGADALANSAPGGSRYLAAQRLRDQADALVALTRRAGA